MRDACRRFLLPLALTAVLAWAVPVAVAAGAVNGAV
jgi:hypothetical protein